MKVEFIKIMPNTLSLNPELIFTFKVFDIEPDKIPIRIQGELFSEDYFKIGDLKDMPVKNSSNLWLYARGSSSLQRNYDFEIMFSCELNEKTISHIENYRLNKKEKTKDIVFNVQLNVQMLESNVALGNLQFGQKIDSANKVEAFNIIYQHTSHYSPQRTNMWILSSDNGPHFLNQKRYSILPITITISLMDWINNYTKYLNIGNFIVYEFLKSDETIFSKELNSRYDKAQKSLTDIKKQLGYGEWKQAIIAARPIFELFKNFDDFKNLLLQNGYTQPAYKELKDAITGLFGLLSKFYHGLDRNNIDLIPEIPVEKEDAYLAYSFSVSLLYLISQKVKRGGSGF